MIEFQAPKDLKDHKKFGVSNGVLYSIPPKVYEKKWNKWNWEKRQVESEDIPLDALYEGPCNPFNLPLDQGDTDYVRYPMAKARGTQKGTVMGKSGMPDRSSPFGNLADLAPRYV